jgi:UDP-glucose 4-epimerase
MILVTGGLGYIGSHVVVELLEKGNEVIIIDNLSNSKPSVLDSIERIADKRPLFIEMDLLDFDRLNTVFSENKISSVIHFAGYKAVGESVAKPLMYYENNLTTTLNLLSVMEKYSVTKLIFSSSATVYKASNPVPYYESYELGSTNPYGWSKYMQEQMLRDYCIANPNFSVALLRYFNPIGASKSGLIGEDPKGIPNNLLPYVAKVATGELETLHIFGDDYNTPDGTGVRDYIHVLDLARGHVLALEYIDKNLGSIAINLGTGNGVSVLDILHSFEKACGKKLPYQIDGRRPGDIGTVFANCDLARELLGFEAKYTIEDMCNDAWKWQQNVSKNS